MTRQHPTSAYGIRETLIACGITAVVVSILVGPSLAKRLFSRAEEGVYSVEEVERHGNAEDCWLIVDGLVFDLTEQSRVHPSMFSCGRDGSENYHENHGPIIRDRMLRFRIGRLDEASLKKVAGGGEAAPGAPEVADIAPKSELFVEKGSWDSRDLMIVMERDNRSLLAIDGSTHEPVGRISDIGTRVHTQVFSPDGRIAYHISRDGWLTKIDLTTLEPVAHVRVGTDSRGTAITESGKYVAVGNYEPNDVVIVDTASFKVVAKIVLADTAGTGTFSRAGGLLDVGEKFIVSLKDARSVWVIDTKERGIAVRERFWDIGEPGDVLHDAFLTPDGRYFLTAVQGSDVVWVLDTKTMREVGEVKAGKTPHTGPGAVWGDTVFVPSLGEGVLAAIDMRNWTLRKLIPTGGAGLFVRGHAEDPSYPYLWADTAFGAERQDQIDIIDAKTLSVVKTLVPMAGKRSVHPEFTRDGKYVYVAVWGGDAVQVYDAKTFEPVKTIPAFTPSGVSSVGIRIEEAGL